MTEQGTVDVPTASRAVDELPAWQAQRRRRIVDAALAALEEGEYEQVQIRDVARDAGVALGTLYRYFSSKDHLYAAVLQEWAGMGRTTDRVRGLPPEERVRARVRLVVAAFTRRPQFFKATVSLQSTADPHAAALLAEFSRAAQESLGEDLATLGPDDARDVAAMLWAVINTTLTAAIYHGRPMSEVGRLAGRFVDLLAPRLASGA